MTHYFFAVSLSQEAKDLLKQQSMKLKEVFGFNRWVHHEDYHITLAFLGHAEAEQLEKAKNLVAQATRDLTSFQLIIDHLGTFGRSDSPRIFWAGVEKQVKLEGLREKVFTACSEAGFALEKRPFHPHITLARKWADDHPFKKEQLVERDLFAEPISYVASEVVLYQTHLDRTPKYETKEIYPLVKND